MKRVGNLWDKICDLENLRLAHKNARKGKAHYSEVQMVNSNEEQYLLALQKQLVDKTFTTSSYTIFDKFDGRKVRTLYKLPYYPDRIVQHALLQVVGPIWTASFIRDTFQSIPCRGTHDARKRVEKVIKTTPNLYALKFDISKYYPNVDNDRLKQEIRRKIKCKNTLWLLDNIIDSEKGIPIGNYTSQYLGNVYLSRFDWWVVQTLKPKAYFRYCDDIVILADTAAKCHQLKDICFEKLKTNYLLTIKSNWQVFPVEVRGLDFVGFVFRNRQTTIRKSISKNFKSKARLIGKSSQKLPPQKIVSGLSSYWGWCKHVNAKQLWYKHYNKKVRAVVEAAKERLK
jgi:RNA-directed DNA polymerase